MPPAPQPSRARAPASEPVLLLFGKVSKTRFSLDYQSPFTAVQAFAVALTSFADKLVVT